VSDQLLDHVHRRIVNPVLPAAFPKRVNGELARGFYAGSFYAALEISQDIVDQVPIPPGQALVLKTPPFRFNSLITFFCREYEISRLDRRPAKGFTAKLIPLHSSP